MKALPEYFAAAAGSTIDGMSTPPVDLPEQMTWDDLARLPEEIAEQIELWNGRPVWVRRGPAEHQDYSSALWHALRRCSRADMAERSDHCWRVSTETNVFFGAEGKNDFVTPDFMVYRCPDSPAQYIRASEVVLVGEVHSPSNSDGDVEAKKARYAGAGIPWYWEVFWDHHTGLLATVRAYALATESHLPAGVTALHAANYVVIGEWSPTTHPDGVRVNFPYPIHITWDELAL